MERYDVTRDELQGILAQLEQALFYYQQWHARMIRKLPCRLPGDQHALSPEAQHDCGFCRWYNDNVPEELRELPGFIALDKAHEHMHQLPEKLLAETQEEDFDAAVDDGRFTNALDHMCLEISAPERPYDKVFCYSGKEFPLLMQHTDTASCCDIEDHLREGLALMSVDFSEKVPIRITTSFGPVLRLFMHQA